MNGQSQGQKPKLSPPVIASIALAAIFGISLYIRIALPYESVFVKDWVWFRGVDAWYHMRLADSLLRNFPHRIFFDPYTFYPHGTAVSWPPFFDRLIVSMGWLVGLGSPSQQTLDRAGAYIPPILGALTIFPVYIIASELFNRWVGMIAAALVTVLPGEFLHRFLLGFTDHHVAETLFSTVVIMFLILAVKRARESTLSTLPMSSQLGK